MKLQVAFSVLACTSLALAAPSQHWTRDHRVFERSIDIRTNGWTRAGAAHPLQSINLKIALREGGDIFSHLNEISDPDHARYGQHLSKEEVDAIRKAPKETHDLVYDWLASYGIHKATVDSNWVNVLVPIQVANEMLGANYGVYEDAAGSRILRTEQFSLPSMLHDHIDVVAPTTYFSVAGQRAVSNMAHEALANVEQSVADTLVPRPTELFGEIAYGGLCNSTNVTLACLAKHYGYENYTSKAGDKNTFGITGFLGEHDNNADLQLFLRTFAPKAEGAEFDVVLVNNGTNPQSFEEEGEGEAALDVQESLGIAYPAKGTFWSTNGIPPFYADELVDAATNAEGLGNEPYLDWLQYVMAQKTVPYVISTSYDDDEQTVPFSYAAKVCNDFAALGARGVTLLFSSGDFGVGGVQPTNCTLNDGSNRHRFLPNFPSSCPAVTSVGGVAGFFPEQVVLFSRGAASGGSGFSNYFSQPKYQKSQVEGYLKKIDGLHKGLFNSEGRAFPDISFHGRNLSIVFNQSYVRISGTSASAPGLAGFLTLVNDARLAANKTTLGFLNPLLYSGKIKGDAFRDTVNGSTVAITPGCNTTGFPALEGWDAATGFGTPRFEAFMEQALAI